MYKKFFKRLFDFILSLIGLIVLSPIILILVILIKLDSKGPVIFRQKRVGRNKEHFYIMKFRTMRVDTPSETPTHMLAGADSYITRVGKFLRKSSLDELPQIWQIFTGEMSIIGPRPALWNQFDLINERDKYHANCITPGLTGWAQVNGRDELPIEVKAQFDGYYYNNLSFILDVKCFFLTIINTINGDGVIEGKK